MKFKRVYHPWDKWEEVAHNMWGGVEDKSSALEIAIEFTGNARLYGSYMMRVIQEWPISCENALTDYSLNRKAWVGHAAAAMAYKLPEDITRLAWGKLSYEQQLLANKEAIKAISAWEHFYVKDRKLREDMGNALLF